MIDNDNVVRIETKTESAKRFILNKLQEKMGISILFEGKNIQLQGPISNEIIANVINKVIMENMWDNVSIGPVTNDTKINKKIKKKKVTIKELILSIFQLKKELKNAEILEELDITEVGLSKSLKELAQEGKIEKVSRGCWRIKETEEEIYKKSITKDIEE